MENIEIKEELREACTKALINIKEIDKESPFEESLVQDLEYVLDSYAVDGNPDGLYGKGSAALLKLHAVQANHPQLVNEETFNALKRALEHYAEKEELEPIHHVVEF